MTSSLPVTAAFIAALKPEYRSSFAAAASGSSPEPAALRPPHVAATRRRASR